MRQSGILMPIFSLPSPYGIGTMGKEAFEFVDFLNKSGQRLWQILPIGPTGFGDSPYQSASTFAGNPYFLDIDALIQSNLLTQNEVKSFDFGNDHEKIDYAKIFSRYKLYRLMTPRFFENTPDDYEAFCEKNAFWLEDYALFCAIKDENEGRAFSQWEDDLRLRNEKAISQAKVRLEKDMDFYKMLQYIFFKQYKTLKTYATEHGVKIIGDIPIYVSPDSADLWANPKQFLIDKDLNLKEVAGCPPDDFCEDGQLWGNPLYDWDYIEKDNFSWWKERIKAALEVFDIVRIDHFRGFESFYCIKNGSENAKKGVWRKGPGMKLFEAVKKDFGTLPIIAEDLGFLTKEVYELLEESGFPGMKILQFAFDGESDSDYLPHNYPKNCVAYTGTHDNDTVVGWFENLSAEVKGDVKAYVRASDSEGINWAMIKTVWASPADTAIVPMADFLAMSSEGRINAPSTMGNNWEWRVKKECLNGWLAEIIYHFTKVYRRIVKEGE